MAVSQKQLAANRANAQHSTGPRTEAGKLISSLNSTTHGLAGQSIYRSHDQDEAYATYYKSMLPDLAPATAFELDFAKRIIHDSWRLNRAGAIDANLLTNGRHEHLHGLALGDGDEDHALAEARAFRADAKTFNLLSLYEQRLQRAVLKNLAALKAMQKERKSAPPEAARHPLKPAQQPAQPIELPMPAPANRFAYASSASNPAPPSPADVDAPENMAA
jgi:hypothetical protein